MHRPDGGQAWVVVEARDGVIYTQCEGSRLALYPDDLSRLSAVFREAQAVALHDRGGW